MHLKKKKVLYDFMIEHTVPISRLSYVSYAPTEHVSSVLISCIY